MTTLKENMNEVFNEIMSMGDDEFQKELSNHLNGDIAVAIYDAGVVDNFFVDSNFDNYMVLNQLDIKSCSYNGVADSYRTKIQFHDASDAQELSSIDFPLAA
ncbi:MAG: hypothetical protein PF482_20795 [Desulfobacteraceae bacterium]|jgi:hypothetical protein|nr:hypothetical protein [Desulfobacteraceae bacterium]